jgi:hypothetical protein
MRGGLGPRFLIEAGFLIAVAVAAGLARLDAIWIIVVMAGAWLLMAAIEWGISRLRRPRAAAAPAAAPTEQPAVQVLTPMPEPEPAAVVVAPPPAAERSEPVPEPAPEPEVTPGPSAEPEAEPEPEPAPTEPVPDRPPVAVAAVPDPEPEPPPPVVEPVAPEPTVQAEEPRVVAMTPRSLGVPQRWNLWELERVAREQSGADAIRDEERSFLLMYLREFADADGVLPTSFDGVVREAFGDALDAVRA